MALVDTQACLRANCPFALKNGPIKGACLKAMQLKKKKEEVCVSNVRIRMAKPNGR